MRKVPQSYAFAYDCQLRRPGCVLLQVAFGGTVPRDVFFSLFDNADWLLAPTPGLKLYAATEGQLEFIAKLTRRRDLRRAS